MKDLLEKAPQELWIERGIPASGKSTHAKLLIEEGIVHVRVNRDDIRYMLFNKGWGVDENQVTRIQNATIDDALKHKQSVVVDNTNLKASDFKAIVALGFKYGLTRRQIVIKDNPVNRQVAVARDKMRRMQGQHYVGEKVIDTFLSRYHIDPLTGVLPRVPEIMERPQTRNGIYTGTPGKPSAYIFDIDGSLAHMNRRGPYDASLYQTDTLDENLALTLDSHRAAGYKVVILSGRNEDHREVTERWLSDNYIEFDAFFMRPSDNPGGNDADVKEKIFRDDVAPNYNVIAVYDDRDRVVERWRAMGVKCYQVAPGAF